MQLRKSKNKIHALTNCEGEWITDPGHLEEMVQALYLKLFREKDHISTVETKSLQWPKLTAAQQ